MGSQHLHAESGPADRSRCHQDLFGRVMQQAEEAKLLSSEHFSVDGTLIRAWASLKSFVPKDGPPPDKRRQQE